MAVNPLKIFLFLLGGSVAAGATAFVSGALDPYLYGKGAGAASVANVPDPAPADPAAPKDERLPGAGEETPPGGTMAATPPPGDSMAATPPPPDTMAAQPPIDSAAVPPAAENPPAGPQPPTFDVLRVEPDGSVVVAGKAIPDALIELLHGEAVVGKSQSTPEGDFVIVLDVPLQPGDYQLTLRATPASGAAVASVETAVLSIPEAAGGQVLAMVEQPGQPAELLTVPQPEAPADQPKTDDAAAAPAEGKPADVASAPADTTPPAESAPKAEEAAAPPAEEKPAEVASAPADTTPPAESAPKIEEAAAPPAEEKPAETTPAPAEAKVAVEAVEIEGNKVFVAGSGDPGRHVRVYANEIMLGESQVSPAGRFLVEAVRELPVGQYMIRADLLDKDGATVLARAIVPFEREEGEAIAAVAPEIAQPAEPKTEEAATPPAEEKPAEVAVAPAETTPPAEAAPKTEEAAVPPAEEKPAEVAAAPAESTPPAESPPKTEEAAAPPAEEKPAEVAAAPAETTPPAEAAPKTEEAVAPPAEEKPAEVATAPAETTPPAEAAPKTEEAAAPPAEDKPAEVATAPAETTPPAEAAPKTEEAAAPPAEEKPAEVAAAPADSTPPDEAAPPETVAPKLTSVKGSVIIRRGDTLWRISRRVYGQGMRFSTIYLANQKQIADPHWIWPGQVFSVPDKTQEGEPADMSAMGGQMIMTTEELEAEAAAKAQ